MKRGTWVLLALVVGLLAFVLFWERRQPGTAEAERAKGRLVPAAVRSAKALVRTGSAPVALEKLDDERWDLTRPVADRADRYSVEGFLDRLAETEVTRWVEGNAPEAFGPGTPKVTWSLDLPDGKTTVELGGPTPLGDGAYIRVDGRLAVVPTALEETLLRPVSDFRAKELLTVGSSDVDSLRYRVAGEERLAFRRAPGGWSVTVPFSDVGDPGRIETLLEDVCACPLFGVVEDAPKELARYGLEPPQSEVRLGTQRGEVVLRLGTPLPDSDPAKALVYAFASDRPASVFSISRNSLRSLEGDSASLRALSPFTRDPYDGTSLAFSGAVSLTLRPDKEGLWRTEAPPANARAEDGAPLFSAVAGIKGRAAETRGDLAAAGLKPPYLTLVLRGDGWEETVEVGTEREGRRYLRPVGRPVLLPLRPEDWQTVEAALAVASGRVPSAPPPAAAKPAAAP